MLKLSLKEAAQKSLEAYERGEMPFQRQVDECLYLYPDGTRCALGWGILNIEELPTSQNDNDIDSVAKEVGVEMLDGTLEDAEQLQMLQDHLVTFRQQDVINQEDMDAFVERCQEIINN